MKLANKIKFELLDYARSHAYDILIPNFFFGGYEMDVFKLMQSGLVVEYEIKISRSDFFADFKKGKGKKHGRMNGSGNFFYERWRVCNRFYYVVPEGLIKLTECPAYAGLIYFHDDWFSTKKSAPLIHKEKQTEGIYKMLAHKLSFRSQVIESKYRRLVREKINYEVES